MATVVNRPNGHKWIQFKSPSGKRATIRLGKTSKRAAEDFRRRVEDILAAAALKHPIDQQTAEWVASLDSTLRKRMAACGLCEPPGPSTVGELLTAFLESANVAKSTRRHLDQSAENLTRYFGENRTLASITPGDASKFRAWLPLHGSRRKSVKTLARTTCDRRTKRAKQIFKHALDHGWITRNPFEDESGFVESNRDRDFFVTREIFEAVMDTATDAEFRTIFAFARIGGLRCPSEVLPLTWCAIDWHESKVRVTAPKNERYEGKATRDIPLFPEIRTALDELWDATGETREELLFPNHQISTTALSNKLQSILRKKGLALWPKPWVNCRASAETELLRDHPIHVVAAWMGHSPQVALKHYAQIEKEQWIKAATKEPQQQSQPIPSRESNAN